PCYYHKADAEGIGFDRTASGSNALEQYEPSVAMQWSDPRTIDPDYLLWFHHVPWNFAVPGSGALWDELVARYDRGVSAVDDMAKTWAEQESFADAGRFDDVSEYLRIHRQEAGWWRDASIAYWRSLNGLGMPAGAVPPEYSLEHYRSLTFPEAPGN